MELEKRELLISISEILAKQGLLTTEEKNKIRVLVNSEG